MYWIGVIFAFIGAGLILFALTFISLVLGGLTNSMITLMAGPVIDGVLNRWERRRLARGG
jgi:ABC-type branched-subunit amino acid transport system permease subunit